MKQIHTLVENVRDRAYLELTKRKSPAAIAQAARKLAAQSKVREAWQLLDLGIALHPRHPELIAAMGAIPNHYDDDFYEDQQTGSLDAAREMLRILSEVHPFRSVVDFGAGVGTWLRVAADYGADDLLALEGDWVKDNSHRFAGARYAYTDLNAPIVLDQRFDLAISVEVAEHLNPDRSQGLIEEVCRSSDTVVFGAAMPRQRGSAHINGRLHSFWADLFRRQGYTCLDLFRPHVWHSPIVKPWYAQNTFLFVAEAVRDRFAAVPVASLVNVYHPLLADRLVRADAEAGIVDPTSPSH